MATSQYSLLRNYTPYTSPYNVDLIKDVMMYKQGKVDANKEKIYNQIDYLMGQDILKSEDRAYLETKMQNMIARINQNYHGVDLSSSGIIRNIQGEISSVLDDNVLNAISGTKAYRTLQKEIDYYKTHHPDKYSPINEQAAMAPVIAWMNDGKTGSKLGSLRYTPYVNVRENIGKKILEFKKNNKGKTVQYPVLDNNGNETGAMIEMNIDEMSESQISNIITSSMSGNEKEQLRIEAEYMAKTSPLFQNADMVNGYMDKYVAKCDAEINALNVQLASAGDNSYLKDKIKNKIEEAKSRKVSTQQEINSIKASGNPISAANFITTRNLYDSLIDTWEYDNTSYLRKKDDFYFAKRKEARDEQKLLLDMAAAQRSEAKTELELQGMNLNNQIKAAELDYMQKHGVKMPTGKTGRSGSGTTPGGADKSGKVPGDPGYNPTSGTLSYQPVVTESQNLAKTVFDNVKKTGESITENKLKLYNNFTEEERKALLKEANVENSKKGGTLFDENDDDGEKIYKYLLVNGGVQHQYIASSKDRAMWLGNIRKNKALLEKETNRMMPVIKRASDILESDSTLSKIEEYIKKRDSEIRYTKNGLKKIAYLAAAVKSDLYPSVLPAMGRGSYNTKVRTDSYFLPYAINKLAELNGDKIDDIYKYINEDGTFKNIKEMQNVPTTIKDIHEFSNINGAYTINELLKDELKKVNDTAEVSKMMADEEYNDYYKSLTFSFADSDQKHQYEALANIMTDSNRYSEKEKEKIESGAGGRISIIYQDDGSDTATLVTENMKVEDGVTVSLDILRENGIPYNNQERIYHVSKLNTDYVSCNFMGGEDNAANLNATGYDGYDTKTNAFNKYIKPEISNAISGFSNLTDDDKNKIIRSIEPLMNLSSHLKVKLSGRELASIDQIIYNFKKLEENDSDNDILLKAVVDLDQGRKYVDPLVDDLYNAPQKAFSNLIIKAVTDRLINISNPTNLEDIMKNGRIISDNTGSEDMLSSLYKLLDEINKQEKGGQK